MERSFYLKGTRKLIGYKITGCVSVLFYVSARTFYFNSRKNLNFKLYGPFLWMGFKLPQGYSHFVEAVYFLPFSPQKFLVLILSTSEGWKAESTLEPPSGFEHGTPGLGIQCLNHLAIAPSIVLQKALFGIF